METTREIALRTYNKQVELGMPNNAMNWHLWKKAFDIADIELSKLRQPDVSGTLPLSEMEKKLDDALAKETPETLKKWLEEKRK